MKAFRFTASIENIEINSNTFNTLVLKSSKHLAKMAPRTKVVIYDNHLSKKTRFSWIVGTYVFDDKALLLPSFN
jgi:hypothetical protein